MLTLRSAIFAGEPPEQRRTPKMRRSALHPHVIRVNVTLPYEFYPVVLFPNRLHYAHKQAGAHTPS